MILIVSIVFLLVFNDLVAPVVSSTIVERNAKWLQLFPKWEQYDMSTQAEIMKIYALSRNKSQWFPDSFAIKPQHSAPIYPRNYLSKRIETLREK